MPQVRRIPAYGSINVTVDVDVMTGATVDDLVPREALELVEHGPSGTPRVLTMNTFRRDTMWWYKDTLTDMAKGFDDLGCNVLVFGIAGEWIDPY